MASYLPGFSRSSGVYWYGFFGVLGASLPLCFQTRFCPLATASVSAVARDEHSRVHTCIQVAPSDVLGVELLHVELLPVLAFTIDYALYSYLTGFDHYPCDGALASILQTPTKKKALEAQHWSEEHGIAACCTPIYLRIFWHIERTSFSSPVSSSSMTFEAVPFAAFRCLIRTSSYRGCGPLTTQQRRSSKNDPALRSRTSFAAVRFFGFAQ